MKESKGTATNANRLYKLQECGDSLDYKKMVDKWRCLKRPRTSIRRGKRKRGNSYWLEYCTTRNGRRLFPMVVCRSREFIRQHQSGN